MIVVSNSSPLITLAKINRLELLQVLYGTIIIPAEVHMEVVVAGAGLPGSISVASQSWVQVHSLVNSGPRVAAQSRYALGAGEMSAILLAHQLRADLVLIDELLSLRNTVTNLCTEPRALASGSRLLTRAVP